MPTAPSESPTAPRCGVIGAGSSGIAVAKTLLDRDLDVTVFETSDRVGGNWVFGNRNRMSSAYEGLHINTSRERMQYADFPMPARYPDYPHHTDIAEYFDAYADRFGLRGHIRFETTVLRAEPVRPGRGWMLTLDAGEPEHVDFLVVANGHHWDARWPQPAFPGTESFTGIQMHAHDYTSDAVFRDRDVVVLGMGNSAMDLAVESSYVARHTWLAARRGAWIIPKYLFGRPFDQIPNDPRIPFAIRQKLLHAVVLAMTGPMERYGLPKPDHQLAQAHPTVSGRILDRIGHGRVTPKPNIERLDRDRVVFADGSSVHADVVVYCTGYRITFPFFDPDLISAPENRIALYRRVFHPDHPDLAFAGLLQPLGATMPLAEAQGRWIAALVRGEYALPDRAAMVADIRRDQRAMRRRYVASKRHTIQVDFDDYLYALERELKAGRARATRARA